MIKKAKNILLLSIILILCLPNTVIANENIKVLLNEEEVIFDQPPIIKNGRTLVPVRAIFEEIGATVNYDVNTKYIEASCDDFTIKMQIDNLKYSVDTHHFEKNKNAYLNAGLNKGLVIDYDFDVPPQIINGRTLVPVGFIFESIGYKVSWDEASKTVYISNENIQSVLPEKNSQLDYELEKAVISNDYKKVEQLLEKGANPNSVLLAIPLLSLTDDLEITKLLIQYSADVNATHNESILDLKTSRVLEGKFDQPIIFDKISRLQLNIVKLYVDNGLDLNAKSMWGLTPYEYAKYVQSRNNTDERKEQIEQIIYILGDNLSTTDIPKGDSQYATVGLTQDEIELISTILEFKLSINQSIKEALNDYSNFKFTLGINKFIVIKEVCEKFKTIELEGNLSSLKPILIEYANSIINACNSYIDYGTYFKEADIVKGTNYVVEAGDYSEDFFEAAKKLDPERWN